MTTTTRTADRLTATSPPHAAVTGAATATAPAAAVQTEAREAASEEA